MKRDDVGKEPFSIYFSSMVAFGNQKKENKNEVLGKRELNPNFVGGKNDMSERRGGEERRPGGDRRDEPIKNYVVPSDCPTYAAILPIMFLPLVLSSMN